PVIRSVETTAYPIVSPITSLSEGEDICLDAGCEEGDFECAVMDCSPLANELMKALFDQRPMTLLVDVEAVSVIGRFPVEEHTERDRCPPGGRSHDEMDIPCVKAERDTSIRRVQHASPPPNRPRPGQGPIVQGQGLRRDVGVRLVQFGALG